MVLQQQEMSHHTGSFRRAPAAAVGRDVFRLPKFLAIHFLINALSFRLHTVSFKTSRLGMILIETTKVRS